MSSQTATVFGDLYKPVKKILSDNYKADVFSFTTKTKHKDDLEIEYLGEKKDDAVDGKVSWKQIFKREKQKYTVNGKLDVNGTVNGSVEAENLYEGLKVKVAGELLATPSTDKKGDNGALTVTFQNENVAVTAELKQQVLKPTQLGITGVFAHNGLSFGVSGKWKANVQKKTESKDDKKADAKPNTDSKAVESKPAESKKEETRTYPATLEQYDVSIRYDRDTLNIVAAVEESLSKVKFSVANQVRKDLAIAGEFLHVFKKAEKTDGKKGDDKKDEKKDEKKDDAAKGDAKKETVPTFTFGVAKKVDDNTSVQAKVNTNGDAAAAYSLKLNSDLEAITTVQTNVFKLGTGAKIGVAFTYSPSEKI